MHPAVRVSIQTRSRSRQGRDTPPEPVESASCGLEELEEESDLGELAQGVESISFDPEEQLEDSDTDTEVSLPAPLPASVEDRGSEMAEMRSLVTPGKFRGMLEEDVEDYLTKFERAARANGWDDARKLILIPCFLEGAPLKWFENAERAQGGALTWAAVKTGLSEAFQTIAGDEQLEYRLRLRMQGEDEPVEAYIQDVINLCSKVDHEMTERSKIRHVLRGMKPSLLEKVMVMNNETLEELRRNIRKIQTARFMAGQRVDQLMAEPSRLVSHGTSSREMTPGAATTNALESKIENLAAEFAKFNMRLLESQSRPNRWDRAPYRRQSEERERMPYRRETEEQQGSQPTRGRGRGEFRGGSRGRTSDGRVICYRCNRIGHFAVNCRSRVNQQGNGQEER